MLPSRDPRLQSAPSEHSKHLLEKLSRLNASQASIESLSLWLRYHRAKYMESTSIWSSQMLSMDDISSPTYSEKRLALIYLANDVIQNTKAKTASKSHPSPSDFDFIRSFAQILVQVFKQVIPRMKESDWKPINRTISIWEERKVFAVLPPSDWQSIGIPDAITFIQQLKKIVAPSSTSTLRHPLIEPLTAIMQFDSSSNQTTSLPSLPRLSLPFNNNEQILNTMSTTNLSSLRDQFYNTVMLPLHSTLSSIIEPERQARLVLVNSLREELKRQEQILSSIHTIEREYRDREAAATAWCQKVDTLLGGTTFSNVAGTPRTPPGSPPKNVVAFSEFEETVSAPLASSSSSSVSSYLSAVPSFGEQSREEPLKKKSRLEMNSAPLPDISDVNAVLSSAFGNNLPPGLRNSSIQTTTPLNMTSNMMIPGMGKGVGKASQEKEKDDVDSFFV